MKKNKHNKQKIRSQDVSVKRSFLSRALRNIGLGLFLFGMFISTMYGYRCFFGKVCGIESINMLVLDKVTITTPRGAVTAEVADTKGSREHGLSGRSSLNKGEGMLFVFDAPGRYGWWVKDMNFPVDIVWINTKGIVVEIERNIQPDSYPKTYINNADANYVLEIGAGEGDRQGLFIGTKVKIFE